MFNINPIDISSAHQTSKRLLIQTFLEPKELSFCYYQNLKYTCLLFSQSTFKKNNNKTLLSLFCEYVSVVYVPSILLYYSLSYYSNAGSLLNLELLFSSGRLVVSKHPSLLPTSDGLRLQAKKRKIMLGLLPGPGIQTEVYTCATSAFSTRPTLPSK